MGAEPSEQATGKEIAPGAILVHAVRLVFRNLRLLAPLALLTFVPSVLQWFFRYTFAAHPFLTSPILVVQMIIAPLASAAMIVAVSERHQGHEVGLTACLRRALGCFWQYVMAVLLCVLIWVAGLLLVIVPGVIWQTTLSMAPQVAVLEERGKEGPLRRSRHLVQGRFWRVLLVLLPLAGGATACFGVGVLLGRSHPDLSAWWGISWLPVYAPFAMSVSTVLYHRLRDTEQDGGPHGALSPYAGCVPGCLAAGGLMAGIAVLLTFWTLTALHWLPNLPTRLFSVPRVELIEGSPVPTPEGWLAVRQVTPTPVYRLYRADFSHYVSAWAFVAPLAALEQKTLKLDSPDFAHAVEAAIPSAAASGGAPFAALSVRTLDIGGRLWGEYAARQEPEESKQTQDRILLYTPVGANLLVIADTHEHPAGASEQKKEQGLEATREEIQRLARALLPEARKAPR